MDLIADEVSFARVVELEQEREKVSDSTSTALPRSICSAMTELLVLVRRILL